MLVKPFSFSGKRIWISAVYILVIIFLFFTGYVRLISNTSIGLLICNAALMCAGAVGILTMLKDVSYFPLLYFTMMMMSWGTNYLIRPVWRYSVIAIVSSVCYMGIAYFLLRNKCKSKMIHAMYYLFAAVVIVQIFVLKKPYRKIMVDGTSHNYVSVLLLFYIALTVMLDAKRDKKTSFIMICMYAFACLMAYGRGGILSAGLLIVGVGSFRWYEKRKELKTIAITVLLVGFIILNANEIVNSLLSTGAFEKFQESGMNSGGRSIIWKQFLSTCTDNWYSFIFGGNPSVITMANKNGEGNLHNSFLQMYASFGLFFFLLNIFLIIAASVWNLYHHRNTMVIVAGVFFLRLFTDKGMFKGYGEIVMYYYIFDFMIQVSTQVRLKRKLWGNKKIAIPFYQSVWSSKEYD